MSNKALVMEEKLYRAMRAIRELLIVIDDDFQSCDDMDNDNVIELCADIREKCFRLFMRIEQVTNGK